MVRTLVALALSSGIVLLGVPRGRAQAFKAGWFERSTQTRRSRSQRRPTHGGLVLALALTVGALVAGPSQPVARAVLAAVVVAVATGWAAERGKGSRWLPAVGQVLAAAAVPAFGVRAGVTGSDAVDAVVTALGALALMRGLRSLERTDGTAPLLVAVAAGALLVAAVRAADPSAPVAAALVGGALAVVGHAWPPAVVRFGAIGPTVAGAALSASAVALEPAVAAPRSMLVPVLALVPLAAAVVVPQWDRRLRRRRLPPQAALGLAALAAAVAAERVAADALAVLPAVALATVPTALLALVGLSIRRPADRPHPQPRDHAAGDDDDRRRAPLGSQERDPSRRGARWALLGLAALLMVVAAVAGLLLVDARRSMLVGREAATDGLAAARDGDLDRALDLFATADAAFADASRRLNNPAVRVGELVPGLAPNLRNVRTLAEVGGDLSSTAVAVAERAGADDLRVVDGRFPVEAARLVSAELIPAVDTLQAAARRLEAADSPLLLAEVREGSDLVAGRIEEASDSIEVAAEATRLAPALLGADADRRWMVAVLTPSEQRGAGGFAGDYAELRTSGGDIELVQELPARALNRATDPAQQLAALPAIYRDRYGGFRPGRFWQNLPATPHIPTFGEAVAAAYPLTDGGGPVDGLITLDPFAIAALLEVTGPVTVPLWPEPLTADNAAQVLLFDHYDRLTEDEIDEFQGDVIEAVVDGLTSGELPPISEIAAILGPQVAAGRLRLWSPEADAQAFFERIGADGSLGTRPAGADFVQLVTQNSGENKIDWFMRRSLDYEATFDPSTGAVNAEATVTITNLSPTSGVSDYIIGEASGPTAPGENELEVTIFSPHRLVEVVDATGRRLPVAVGREQGLRSVTVFLEIPAGQEATVTATFAGALPPGSDYQLVLGRQPAVVPDVLRAEIAGAPGWRPIDPSDAALEADTDGPARVEVRFQR